MATKHSLTNGNTSNHTNDKKSRIDYENISEKFVFKSRNYSKQYFHMYSFRLNEMTKLLKPKVQAKWGSKLSIKKLCELREEDQEKCIIIGTIFKHQKYKPSILREISEENQLAPQPQREYYFDESDKLILEDELQRIRLIGKIDIDNIATGVVCAILGYVESDGKFIVEDHLFYESGPQKLLKPLNTSPLLVFISGLDQTSAFNYTPSMDALKNWLSGNIATYGDEKKWNSSNIVRIIIAGNSIRSTAEVKQKSLQMRKAEYPDPVQTVKELDKWFNEWLNDKIDVDVMPGEHDPTNYMLPQQPLHNCMFPEAKKHETFKSVTNPYNFLINERLCLGTAGQNINDIMRISKMEDPLEVVRSTLKWSHIAPTSPDTLPSYPYIDEDPFIISECPHIYFAGNLGEFQTEMHEGSDGQKTRLVCIPSFVKNQSIAVVDLNTLNCGTISFKIKDE